MDDNRVQLMINVISSGTLSERQLDALERALKSAKSIKQNRVMQGRHLDKDTSRTMDQMLESGKWSVNDIMKMFNVSKATVLNHKKKVEESKRVYSVPVNKPVQAPSNINLQIVNEQTRQQNIQQSRETQKTVKTAYGNLSEYERKMLGL